MKLLYKGKHGAHIVGIPARDIDHAELLNLAITQGYGLDAFAALLCSRGLYVMEADTLSASLEAVAKPKRIPKMKGR